MKRVICARGYRYAGLHAGVKVERKDLALIASDRPAAAACVVTQNAARAACVDRTARLLPTESIHAVVINSGNANALAGEDMVGNDERMAAAVARSLGVPTDAVISASTGSIGLRLPIEAIEAATPKLVDELSDDPYSAAEAMLTTDRVVKLASRSLDIDDEEVRITGLAKGSGMIHPNMATMLAYLCTDARCESGDLERILREAVAATFNQISVDRDTSTNDMVLVLANGASGVRVDARTEGFVEAVLEVCEDLARQIAADGEGATRLLSVKVSGATDLSTARALSRAAVESNLFKCSVFGDLSGWGRCLAAIGARAAELGVALDPARITARLNDQLEFLHGRPAEADIVPSGPEVVYEIDLGLGDAEAWAWGCDLSYDYVSINAVSKSEPLETHSPGLKRRLLVEALSYIKAFAGTIAVIKYGGAAMVRDDLKDAFAEDLVLLKAAGLLPVVVHGGGPDITRVLERLGKKTTFVDGMRVTDAYSMKIVEMVLTGHVNTDVVTRIHKFGGEAIGLSGKDGSLLTAKKLLLEGKDLGMVGTVEQVRTDILHKLLDDGFIPVISPVGVDAHGTTYNVNADSVAAEVAVALQARKILYLTDVPGIKGADGDVISQTTPDHLDELVAGGVVKGGMRPKVESLLSAVHRGVRSGHIIDGRIRHNLLAELFTSKGVGSWVVAED